MSVKKLIKDGISYGEDQYGTRFYKLGNRWYSVDKEQNVIRIK